MNFVMIFIDGLGLGGRENNPVVSAKTPNIDRLLGGHYLWGERSLRFHRTYLYSLDASLGVKGIPQSATGQTTLWTGLNAAKVLGYHLNAYPNEKLVEIINNYSIMKQLADKGKRVTFANAFTHNYEELITAGRRKHSASTLCALAAGVSLRRRIDLLDGKAVYQDITNELFRKRGEDVPVISPYEAGQNLGKLILDYDFTLFEYFQTDIRGHKRDFQKALEVIERLDEFLGGFFSVIESIDESLAKIAFLLTSDHGNIEDLSTTDHTLNKVPALCWSNFGLEWPEMKRLEDVTPVILDIILSKC